MSMWLWVGGRGACFEVAFNTKQMITTWDGVSLGDFVGLRKGLGGILDLILL